MFERYERGNDQTKQRRIEEQKNRNRYEIRNTRNMLMVLCVKRVWGFCLNQSSRLGKLAKKKTQCNIAIFNCSENGNVENAFIVAVLLLPLLLDPAQRGMATVSGAEHSVAFAMQVSECRVTDRGTDRQTDGRTISGQTELNFRLSMTGGRVLF